MSLGLMHLTVALAFLAVYTIAGEILVRRRRDETQASHGNFPAAGYRTDPACAAGPPTAALSQGNPSARNPKSATAG